MCLPLRSVQRQRRGAPHELYIQEYAAPNKPMLVRGRKRVAVAQGRTVSAGKCTECAHIGSRCVPFPVLTGQPCFMAFCARCEEAEAAAAAHPARANGAHTPATLSHIIYQHMHQRCCTVCRMAEEAMARVTGAEEALAALAHMARSVGAATTAAESLLAERLAKLSAQAQRCDPHSALHCTPHSPVFSTLALPSLPLAPAPARHSLGFWRSCPSRRRTCTMRKSAMITN